MRIFLGMIDLWETARSPAGRETGGAKNASSVYTPIRQQIVIASEMGGNVLAVLAARPVAPNNLTLGPLEWGSSDPKGMGIRPRG
jgi:hypothetical protein